MEQTAFATRAEPFGTIRVTAPVPIRFHIIAPALPAFRARFPKVSVDLRLTAPILGNELEIGPE
ncbi:hypothetical protein CPY51_23105 [Rhizobium tubonense]|uniref:LysR substrate-binding domain-containing protein n=1 Tax=Rhizobium tubonense TaxID=484088 RepID=A0A2W4CAW5_9HYPH|nr:hypothetical protein CPY51_23105 [Rhizobium tubonense]